MAKKLSSQAFVVTGTLQGYSRAKAKKEIEALCSKVSVWNDCYTPLNTKS
jgi:NAD-dependent DNA ligase|tara:strand:+ start:1550 stop:1699 length:150 start_codon:yes stop_codon:yes gene_type:complete